MSDAVLSLLDVSLPEALVPISRTDQQLKVPIFHRRSGTLASELLRNDNCAKFT